MENLVEKAIKFATESHNGQFRKWGVGIADPYIVHPLRVEKHCEYFTSDRDVLAAAVLHDTVEDCENISLKDITNLFGVNVSLLVWELTNPSKQFPSIRRRDRKQMDRDHIAEASADAQAIKACDRIDNLRDMKLAPLDFVRLYTRESQLLSEVLVKIPDELREELITAIEDCQGIGVYFK